MGFVAADAVQPLEFDLAPYGPKGCVPEPSDKQLIGFQRAMQKSLANRGIEVDTSNPAAAMQAIARLDVEDQTQFLDDQLLEFAELCGGQPSLEELQGLPIRIRNAFLGWLMGQFNDPGTSPSGTSG